MGSSAGDLVQIDAAGSNCTTVGSTGVLRDFEEVLDERGVYLLRIADLPSGMVLLYAPCDDLMMPISESEASLLRRAKANPRRLEALFESLTGRPLLQTISDSPEHLENYTPVSVALMLTTACQLRCTYCYADAGNTPTAYLDYDTAISAINLVSRNSVNLGRKSFTVHFHGAGEPTLAWDTIQKCMDYATQRANECGLTLRMVLTTNLCISPEKAIHAGRTLDAILVSCDGPPEVMLKSRPMVHGDSGDVLFRALDAIVKDGHAKKIWIRSTITRDTQERLEEFVDFFAGLGLKNVYLVPVSASGRGVSQSAVDVNAYLASWARAKARAKALGVNLESPVANPNKLHPDGYACGISGSNFAVMPTGQVSLCYEAVLRDSPQWNAFHVGAYDESTGNFSVDLQRVNRVRDQFHVSKRRICDTCFCRLTCAGHCAAREFSPGEDPRNIPMTPACDIIRSITALEISELLKGENDG